jgi:hypothetical protein
VTLLQVATTLLHFSNNFAALLLQQVCREIATILPQIYSLFAASLPGYCCKFGRSEPIWASKKLIQCLASCASELQPTSTHGDQEGSYYVNIPHPWEVQGRKYGCVPGTTFGRVADFMARGSNRRHVKGPSQSPIQPSSNSNVDNA